VVRGSTKGKVPRAESVADVISCLLENRGLVSDEEKETFFNPPNPQKYLESPELVGIPSQDLERAVGLVRQAIAAGRPIIIHGDYDVDGICATAILWETIYRGLNYENCRPFVPDRFKHGYGLTRASIDAVRETAELSDGQTALLITVDCGITAHDAIRYAESLGFAVLVTDHHQKEEASGPQPPPSSTFRVGGPKTERFSGGGLDSAELWTDQICGAGIAWVLAQRLHPMPNLDLVALATVADIQSLLGPNRAFVKHGLEELNRTSRVGLRELARLASLSGKDIGTYEVGWVLAPRLNAPGRLGSALDALRLLLTNDRVQAGELAETLERINRERRGKTAAMVEHALGGVMAQASGEAKVLIAHHTSYHEGVIGLLAGRLTKEFHRPAIAIAEGKEFSKGSARSVPGLNIIELLREVGDLLESVGGHPMAAGFIMRTENIVAFEERVVVAAEPKIDEDGFRQHLAVDCEIPLTLVSWGMWEELQRFEPFGTANPRPVFLSRGVGVVDVSTVGGEGQHLKLRVRDANSDALGGEDLTAVGFGLGSRAAGLCLGTLLGIVYSLGENCWNGRRSLELYLKDFRPHEGSQLPAGPARG